MRPNRDANFSRRARTRSARVWRRFRGDRKIRDRTDGKVFPSGTHARARARRRGKSDREKAERACAHANGPRVTSDRKLLFAFKFSLKRPFLKRIHSAYVACITLGVTPESPLLFPLPSPLPPTVVRRLDVTYWPRESGRGTKSRRRRANAAESPAARDREGKVHPPSSRITRKSAVVKPDTQRANLHNEIAAVAFRDKFPRRSSSRLADLRSRRRRRRQDEVWELTM